MDRRHKEHLTSLRAKMKEYRKLTQFRIGSRKGQSQPAKWTAMLFVGYTIRQIADIERLDESVVRKAVRDFVERASLKLPDREATR